MAILEVRLFGQAQLRWAGEPLPVRVPPRAVSLLAYLLLNREKPLPRDAVAFTFWTDLPEVEARTKLRTHLHYLTSAGLPPAAVETPWLLADKRSVRWNPAAPVWIDVAEFERLAGEPSQAPAAVELYAGDLLAGCDDEWLEAPRTHLRERQLGLLRDLIERSRGNGDRALAIGYSQRLLAIDPWREDAIREQMTLRHESGDRAGALQLYREFAQRLKAELGVDPTAETAAVYERVASTDAPTATVRNEPPAHEHNVPVDIASFVGREREIGEVRALVENSRLVTVLGAGGVGKTRLALHVARDVLAAFADGVWLVELAPVAGGSLVAGAVASALGLQESPKRTDLETLLAYLKSKSLLLVLDNAEHLIADVAKVVEAILRACPRVSILATSREPLAIGGERTYRTPSLAFLAADSIRHVSAAQAAGYGAIALFVERAQARDDRFTLTDENAPVVADICRRLDGIALAIELAAARVKVLSLKTLAEKLDDRFRVLTGGSRTTLARQQTMRALIDWSYDLLSERERRFFRWLAIFAGGFTLEPIEAVCGDDTIADAGSLDLVTSLVEKSLVQAESTGDETRYRLLDSTREYAREKLAESGELEAASRAHAIAFVERAERLESAWGSMSDRVWDTQTELDDWRAALTWAFAGPGDVAIGRRLTAALRQTLPRLGWTNARRWIRTALESADDATPARLLGRLELAEARLALGALAQYKTALAAAERAIAFFEKAGEPLDVAEAQTFAGVSLAVLGRASEGRALLQTALQAFRIQAASPRMTAQTLVNLAIARAMENDVAGSRPLLAEALAIYCAIGADRTAGYAAQNLAEAEFQGGDAAAALRAAGDALAAHRAAKDEQGVAGDLSNMAAYLVALRRWDEASQAAREALALACEWQLDVYATSALQHLAAVAALQPGADAETANESCRRAARLLGFADARFAALDAVREYTEQQERDAVRAALRDALGEDEFATLAAEGSTWTLEYCVLTV